MDKSFRNLPISNNINDEEIKKQTQIRATINQLLLETGEKEKLKELLRNKLVECGWRDNMKNYCREIIKAKGVENITLEELVNELIPKGRENVPPEVKAELLTKIRQFITTHSQKNIE